MADRDQTATVDIKIRMREPLRAKIEKAAARRRISMNAEMVERLAKSFDLEQLKEIVEEAVVTGFRRARR